MNITNFTHNVEIYSRNDKPFGKSWEEWASIWWQWCYKTELQGISPCEDKTGESCHKNQSDYNVWFLAGTFGGNAVRTCSIPSNKSIFFPIVNDLISFAGYKNLKTEAELNEYAKNDLDTTSTLITMVDEIKLQNLRDFRVRTNTFYVTYPLKFSEVKEEQNSFIETKAISDGYWIFLKPLPIGNHSIYFKGVKFAYDDVIVSNYKGNEPKFEVEVKYNINVH